MVCFDFHIVDGIDVAMHLALTLLKLEDCASNMVTRSPLTAWMDAVIRALRMDFAKTRSPPLLQCHQLYKERIQAQYVPILLFFALGLSANLKMIRKVK